MEELSNSDLLDSYVAFQVFLDAQFEYWLTVSFAAIVAGAVTGERLGNRTRQFLAVLYIFATTLFVFRYFAVIADLTIIADEVRLRTIVSDFGQTYAPIMLIIRGLLFVAGTLGTIWFLLKGEKMSLVQETSE